MSSTAINFIFSGFFCRFRRQLGLVFVSGFLLFPAISSAQSQCFTWFGDSLAHLREPLAATVGLNRAGLDRAYATIAMGRVETKNRGPFHYAELLKTIGESADTPHGSSYESLWLSPTIRVWQKNIFGETNYENVTPEVLANSLKRNLLPDHKLDVHKLMALLMNSEKVKSFMIDLKKQVLQEMWDAGIRIEDFSKPEVREYYVDIVLAKRARKVGFSVSEKGLPFDMVTFSEDNFFRYFTLQRVFVDWSGAKLLANGSPHYARGHLLQMVYAGENFPGFANLIKLIGHTRDQEQIWFVLFDNAIAGTTPLAGGWWVEVFKDFLGIRY